MTIEKNEQMVLNRRTALRAAAMGLGGLALGSAGVQQAVAGTPSRNGTAREKRTYVLVHGAWFGGWVWRDVAPRLREMGHTVWTPTLTGLGERRHLARAGYDLTTHVDDVVAEIEMEDLRNIHLVGWSYGGMVVTGVLGRVADRISSMTYFDAFAPKDGQAMTDLLEPWVLADLRKAQAANQPLAPIPMAGMALTDPKIVAFAQSRVTPQAWQTYTTPVKTIQRPAIPFTYIRCKRFNNPSFDRFHQEFAAAGHATHTLDAGHVAMLDHVEDSVRLLANVA